jgi:hypothetical protein
MKKLFTKIIFFILPLIALLYPADYFVSKNLAKSGTAAYGETRVWNDIYTGQIASKIVVYGSSRAWVHVDPKLLQDSLNTTAYNLGIDGHNFRMQYFRHRQLLKYNTKPKYILLSLDVFSLLKLNERYNNAQYLSFSLFNWDMASYTAGHEDFSQLDYYIPFIRYAGQFESIAIALQNARRPDTTTVRQRGYTAQDRLWTDDLRNAQDKMEYFNLSIDPDLWKLLKQFVAECKKDNIKLVFINSPEYIEGQKFERNRDKVLQQFMKYAKQQHILYLDYSKSPLCYKKAYFYNASHLNRKGSQLFTKQLIADLKKNEPDIVNCGR